MSVLVLVLAACSADADVALQGGAASRSAAAEPAAEPEEAVAWHHLAVADGLPDGQVAAAAVESADDLQQAWKQFDFPGDVPPVDFERSFVLLLGQPDDDCIDELIRLEVIEGRLRVKWLPPPGGCTQPLVFRIHAVEVDRRHVPARFKVAFEEPYAADAEPVTLEVAAADGAAPPEPQPPQAMTEADLDAVFADHPVRRCTPADDPLANEPRVATDDPPPMDEMAASDLIDDVRRLLRERGYRHNRDFVPYISRADGVRPAVWVDDGNAGSVGRLLDDEFGNGAVVVVENRYDFEAIQQTQYDIGALMGGDEPGSIVSSTGIPGPVELGMIDPTREALDRVAAAVDPALVCVDPALSGVVVD